MVILNYVHLGNDVSLFEKDIVGVFDIEKTSIKKSINEFLKKQQKNGKIYYCSLEMPKSFILSQNKTFISNVSTLTLIKRLVNT
ncbi:MAG: DUF370 domain-containing protein [Oscillospiraceae bacterium]|nr:DUF370 domain-containing protein [Oscillospiraceae bacterium]